MLAYSSEDNKFLDANASNFVIKRNLFIYLRNKKNKKKDYLAENIGKGRD